MKLILLLIFLATLKGLCQVKYFLLTILDGL